MEIAKYRLTRAEGVAWKARASPKNRMDKSQVVVWRLSISDADNEIAL